MNTRKNTIIILMLVLLINVFSGCGTIEALSGKPVKFVSSWYAEHNEGFSESALGGIRKDGEFKACDANNMLKFQGYYRGYDFITFVFDAASPINEEHVRRSVDTNHGFYFQGAVYQTDLTHKYVTFQYKTRSYVKSGETVYSDAVSDRVFKFPLNGEEHETYYSIGIRGNRGLHINTDVGDYDLSISSRIQTDIIEESYWTDYRYDQLTQYFNAETGKWTEQEVKNKKTDYMPLE